MNEETTNQTEEQTTQGQTQEPVVETEPTQTAEAEKTPGKETRSEKKEKKSHLEEKLKELEKTASLQEDKYKRILAEYDNFRKRTQKEKESTYSDAQISTIGAFLPVLDNLERAAAQESADEGVRLILKQFQDILSGKYHVAVCGAEGEAFDPNLHNAVMHAEGEGTGETVIAQVLQKGYTMDGRLIRAAMVKTTD